MSLLVVAFVCARVRYCMCDAVYSDLFTCCVAVDCFGVVCFALMRFVVFWVFDCVLLACYAFDVVMLCFALFCFVLRVRCRYVFDR